ncbi:MAG: SDR family oxidoreductase [Armatimonadota bacterium]
MAERVEGERTRVALVAGANGAIGRAAALRLARDGCTVYAGYREGLARGEAVVAEMQAGGGSAELIHLDLRDAALVKEVCATVYKRQGSLDILVNAAAINREMPTAGMDDNTWREVLATNLDGAFFLCREAAKYMVLGGWGRIVNVSSVSAQRGGRGQANYAASKAGMESLTRVLALELGRKGVLANCVAPGVISAGMSERIRRDHGGEILHQIALSRFGAPDEVGSVIGFLCSEDAGYITGQVISVDGGLAL